jgi:hypothetical protein
VVEDVAKRHAFFEFFPIDVWHGKISLQQPTFCK